MTFGPYPATVVSVHDGDTCTLMIDLGFNVALKANCRAFGINAPELRTEEGKIARDYAQTLLTPGMKVTVISYGWDKYGGRFDGIITFPDGTNWSDRMIESDHAVKYA